MRYSELLTWSKYIFTLVFALSTISAFVIPPQLETDPLMPLEAISTFITYSVEEATSTPVAALVEAPVAKETYDVRCFCVAYARTLVPEIPRRNADQFVANSPPAINSLALLQYENVSHVAVVKALMPKGFYVYESNFKKCTKTERFIPFDSKEVKGFWSPLL